MSTLYTFPTERPPPINSLNFTVSGSTLTINWVEPSNRSNIALAVTGDMCGCKSMNISVGRSRVDCTGWEANNQTCTFALSAVSGDCEFMSAPVNEALTLAGEVKIVHQFV